jgi:hypothetical protein
MTTEEIIIAIFVAVDDKWPDLKKHPQAKLYPSELVTIGILFALKGVGTRANALCHTQNKLKIASIPTCFKAFSLNT